MEPETWDGMWDGPRRGRSIAADGTNVGCQVQAPWIQVHFGRLSGAACGMSASKEVERQTGSKSNLIRLAIGPLASNDLKRARHRPLQLGRAVVGWDAANPHQPSHRPRNLVPNGNPPFSLAPPRSSCFSDTPCPLRMRLRRRGGIRIGWISWLSDQSLSGPARPRNRGNHFCLILGGSPASASGIPESKPACCPAALRVQRLCLRNKKKEKKKEKEIASENLQKQRIRDKGEIRTRAPLLRPGS